MTEKEKQYLKAKIGELQEEAFDKNMNFLSSYHEGGYNALCKVENIIASMQEEPLSEKKCMYSKDSYTDEDRKVLCKDCDEKCEYSKKEEPVSELLNTESMIESYKQRLISQANGMMNSPLIDMCLASYKHGINETLDTLNLSNVERWKELEKLVIKLKEE